MYSVIRFIDITNEQMQSIASCINGCYPAFCSDIKPNIRDSHCFSFPLISAEVWECHHMSMIDILDKIHPAIVKSKKMVENLRIQIDLEIGYSDYSNRFITEIHWEPKLLRLITELEIVLVISFYNPNAI
jgi:hypothetical protein